MKGIISKKFISLVLISSFFFRGMLYPQDFLAPAGVTESRVLSTAIVGPSIPGTRTISLDISYHNGENKALVLKLIKKDPDAWVGYADMLELRKRNDYYGREIVDYFIKDALYITQNFMAMYGGYAYQSEERADGIIMVLPGGLPVNFVKSILWNIQNTIHNRFKNYGFALLWTIIDKDSPFSEINEIFNSIVSDVDAFKFSTVLPRFKDFEKYDLRTVQTMFGLLFEKSLGITDIRKYLDNLFLKNKFHIFTVEEFLSPFYPVGAVRVKKARNKNVRLSNAIEEAGMYQRIGRENNMLFCVEGMNGLPAAITDRQLSATADSGLSLFKSDTYEEALYTELAKIRRKQKKLLRELKQYVLNAHDKETADMIELEKYHPVFERRNLYLFLEYVASLPCDKTKIFIVREPPDRFYFITTGRITNGKENVRNWQIIQVQQIIEPTSFAMKNKFRETPGFQGKNIDGSEEFSFNALNKCIGHRIGNQLIGFDIYLLLRYLNEAMRFEGPVFLEKDKRHEIRDALTSARNLLNNIIAGRNLDFKVDFKAAVISSDDFLIKKETAYETKLNDLKALMIDRFNKELEDKLGKIELKTFIKELQKILKKVFHQLSKTQYKKLEKSGLTAAAMTVRQYYEEKFKSKIKGNVFKQLKKFINNTFNYAAFEMFDQELTEKIKRELLGELELLITAREGQKISVDDEDNRKIIMHVDQLGKHWELMELDSWKNAALRAEKARKSLRYANAVFHDALEKAEEDIVFKARMVISESLGSAPKKVVVRTNALSVQASQ